MAAVLLVDDEASIIDFLMELVVDAGHTVVAAGNGVDALRLAEQYHPALIICDVMMPVLDGFGLLQALRSDLALMAIPVILMSAAANRAHIERLGATFISKPFDLDVIEDLLRKLPI